MQADSRQTESCTYLSLRSCRSYSGSEPLKDGLPVRQGRGAVAVPHGCQHGLNMWHRPIQLTHDRTEIYAIVSGHQTFGMTDAIQSRPLTRR